MIQTKNGLAYRITLPYPGDFTEEIIIAFANGTPLEVSGRRYNVVGAVYEEESDCVRFDLFPLPKMI